VALLIGDRVAVSWIHSDVRMAREDTVSDLDNRRAGQDARSSGAGLSRPTRYAVAMNRYLGAAVPTTVAPEATPSGPVVSPAGVVLVGADNTPTSCVVVDHAAIEAELRGWDLRILHAQQGRPVGSSRDAGARLLRQLTDRVHAGASSVPVNSRLVVGSAASLLLAEARAKDLLVVGNHHGAALGLSVADRLAGHHEGVLLMVRVPSRPNGPGFGERPIVVGVDQPGAPAPAAQFALREARLRGCGLVMLSARHGPAPADRAETVDGVLVHHRIVDADLVTALTDFSHRAAALVVGRRGFGGHPVTMIDSVSHAMIQKAGCPVFLV
jgi:nucleotide-binding universal stress UspA family protein